jgi:cytochrome c oxidase subunit 2
LVIGAGVALPIVLLVALFVYADLFAMNATSAPPKGSTELTIDVTGHQFWWDVAYRGTTAVTANEIHVPVHTRVAIVTHTADVIHSFWIPELNRKMDMIPGQENRVLIDANTPGVYAGHCAEFCGLQHAHMVVLVVAQPRAAFDRWLARESKPAAESTSRGAQLFQHLACASCHQIRGTAAHGRVGPDLTHFASRTTLGAVRLTNNAHNVARWLRDPQAVKPGNKMPDLALPDSDWVALERYMESLR